MDIETKEAVLKLAGYELTYAGTSDGGFVWVVKSTETHDQLGWGITQQAAVNVGFNTFLTRQNEVDVS